MHYYIGLDVHSRNTTGTVVNEKGEIKLRKTFPTSEANLSNFLSQIEGAKTDTKDALHLVQELRVGHLKGVYHDASQWIELRVLVNNYLGLVEDIIRSKNRLKAVFEQKAWIQTRKSSIRTKKTHKNYETNMPVSSPIAFMNKLKDLKN